MFLPGLGPGSQGRQPPADIVYVALPTPPPPPGRGGAYSGGFFIAIPQIDRRFHGGSLLTQEGMLG